MVMKNWKLISVGNEFTPPELKIVCLDGNVYGSDKFEDGAHITTSRIKDIEIYEDYKVVVTKNSRYKVFEKDIDKCYEAQYPEAYKRLKNMNKG